MNVENSSELSRRIGDLKREKNAVILAHYYTTPEVQAVADFLGDSLALSVRARSTPTSSSSPECTSWPRPPRSSAPKRRC